MKSVVTSLLAASLLCLAAGLPSAASAGDPGHVVKDPGEPRGPWEARVRWVDVHTDPRSGNRFIRFDAQPGPLKVNYKA